MWAVLFILLIPLCAPWVIRHIWPHDITWEEILLHTVIVIAVTSGTYYLGMVGQSIDLEVWNGKVTGKEKNWVSCEHSYECNCTTSTDSNGNTTRSCQTCYDHLNDWDWDVYSNVDSTTTIARIDRQGSDEPPRWTEVKIGDPYSDTKYFKNYIKGAPDSLFNDKGLIQKFQNLIPEYPNDLHDYYKINRVLSVGVPVPDLAQWNHDLSMILRELGPKRKANVVILFVKTNDTSYTHALKEAWLSGKKNDTVIVFGITAYPKIDFVSLFSWSANAMYDTELTNALQALSELDRGTIIPIINTQVMKNFKKRSMEEYAYLAEEVVPPVWLLLLTCFISFFVSGVAGFIMYRYDISFSKRRSSWKYTIRR